MTCAELDILICDYVDGILEGDRKGAFEQHLAECATCAELVRDVSAAVTFIEDVPAVEPPDELVTSLLFQIPRSKPEQGFGGVRGLFTRWLEPVLQPRFAMGMAMTILSFSLVAKFTGVRERQLTPADLHPAKVWAEVDDRFHNVWDRVVKYYDSLRVVYEVQNRLSEWSEEDEAAARESAPLPFGVEQMDGDPENPEGIEDTGERSVSQ